MKESMNDKSMAAFAQSIGLKIVAEDFDDEAQDRASPMSQYVCPQWKCGEEPRG